MMAVCGILETRGRVLLCKRMPWVRYPGLWELPTFEYGGVGAMEDVLDQGLFERLSVMGGGLDLLFTQNMRNLKDCRVWVYGVNGWQGRFSLSGYAAFRFIPPQKMKKLPIAPGNVTFIKKFFSFRENM